MKIIKPRNDLILLFGPIIFLATLAVAVFLRQQILMAYYFNWALLGLLAVIIFTPWGSRRLAAPEDKKPTYPIVNCLWHIIILQACLLAVFMGINDVISRSVLVHTTEQPTLFAQTLNVFFTHYGLLPWTFYTLTAISMGYCSYRNNQDAYFSTTLEPIFKSGPQQALGLISNTTAKQSTVIAIATTFAFMILLSANLMTGGVLPLSTGFQPGSIFLALIVLVICITPIFKRQLHQILQRKIPIFAGLLIISAVLAIIIMLLSTFFAGLATRKINIPNVIQKLINMDWTTSWYLFASAWWLAWTPMVGALLARACRGYTIRAAIINTLIFPIVVTIFVYSGQQVGFNIEHHHPIMDVILAIMGFFGLLMILTTNTNLPMMLMNYLPARDHFKYRDHHSFFRRNFILTACTIYLYLPAGVGVAYLFILVLTLPMIVFALIAAAALVKLLITDVIPA